ncbi:MAG: DNA protecting protein DprA [Candidatus Levybacteria bacterium RIFCSPLOWO2_01_FULL_39_24]|nr:MAG: DNA protecting protein DprA [Candidatus Levybacteria bacterium RIFCSPHIGHO2_01_FULL_40_16]OGH46340.1 MAG: DNA protecting protein DprA [Candidatus Levybacteria bacterium RIFCSPLOWO2_01_FULL_39_24]
MSERDYWLGFSALPGIGPAKFRKILKEFGTAKAAWGAKKSDFSIEEYLKQLKEKDVWFVTLLDEDYPQILKEIKNPPFVLYGRGQVPDDTWFAKTIAVVGARKTTQYGREVTKLLTTELVLNGFTIVSGLALGVDAISHLTALENGGKTIAVLGCGVDCCSPMENFNLYNSILEKGNCIVSEFPLGMKPTQWTFPARNRIIAGLSQAVLVTEGAEDSGSLITAKFALRFDRKVFAVPGPITSSMSKGPYKLISKGAKLVTSAEDIFKELKTPAFAKALAGKQNSKVQNATKDELIILKLLENEALHFDEIIRKTKYKSSQLSSLLSLMEIKGMVKSIDGGMYGI